MIEIRDKKDCVGCEACCQRCPQQCIEMTTDVQGFLYPVVDVDRCINCGLCEKVCPVINQAHSRKPAETYAAKNCNEEIQLQSSSGGVFYALAKRVIENGGVVFGARFDDNWAVVHDYSDSLEGLKSFQTSKYVQSRIGNSFLQVEKFLKEGRLVLFSGTPCQIAGLRLFLRKEYDNLLAMDMVCHGVPSPLVWQEYLKYIIHSSDASKEISSINFRDKRMGWNKFGLSVKVKESGELAETEILFEPYFGNVYVQAFLKDLDLRPSCYTCPAKCGKSGSDLTLADFWGIRKSMPEYYDQNGVSLVMTYSGNGTRMIDTLPIDCHRAEYANALMRNPAIEESAAYPIASEQMWKNFFAQGIEGIITTLESLSKEC